MGDPDSFQLEAAVRDLIVASNVRDGTGSDLESQVLEMLHRGLSTPRTEQDQVRSLSTVKDLLRLSKHPSTLLTKIKSLRGSDTLETKRVLNLISKMAEKRKKSVNFHTIQSPPEEGFTSLPSHASTPLDKENYPPSASGSSVQDSVDRCSKLLSQSLGMSAADDTYAEAKMTVGERAWIQKRRKQLSGTCLASTGREEMLPMVGWATEQPKFETRVGLMSDSDMRNYFLSHILTFLQDVPTPEIQWRRVKGKDIAVVNPAFSDILRTKAERILVVGSDIHIANAFIMEHDGTLTGVAAAELAEFLFSSVMEAQLKDCSRLFALHKRGSLFLEGLWKEMGAMAGRAAAGAELVGAFVSGSLGGAVLDPLASRWATGSLPHARPLYRAALVRASASLFEQLRDWLQIGSVVDYHREFFIIDKATSAQKAMPDTSYAFFADNKWGSRFEVIESLVPSFLAAQAEAIRWAGFYRRIVDEVDDAAAAVEEDDGWATVAESFSGMGWTEVLQDWVRRRCTAASADFLAFLRRRHDLERTFRLHRDLFTVMKGDWLNSFLRVAASDLAKPTPALSLLRIQRLLDSSIAASSLASDAVENEVRLTIEKNSIIQFLQHLVQIDSELIDPSACEAEGVAIRGLDAVCVSVELDWPLPIVFDSRSTSQYQILFRQLLVFHSVVGRIREIDGSKLGRLGQQLRCQMAGMLENYLHYLCLDVLQPNFKRFFALLSTASTMEEVLTGHSECLLECTKDGMVTEEALLGPLSALLGLATSFAAAAERRAGGGRESEWKAAVGRMGPQLTAELGRLASALRSLASAQETRLAPRFVRRADFLLSNSPFPVPAQ